MRLLRTDYDELILETFNNERWLPPYAVLSHTWYADHEEVTFGELGHLDIAKRKAGWTKLEFARRQAFNDGLRYVWADTCCIDKSSSAELAEAINSMYRWYQHAQVCYVYLDDFSRPDPSALIMLDPELVHQEPLRETKPVAASEVLESVAQLYGHSVRSSTVLDAKNEQGYDFDEADLSNPANRVPRRSSPAVDNAIAGSRLNIDLRGLEAAKWFSRGWTLQELLAPKEIHFFSSEWTPLGSLTSLAKTIAAITGIHINALNKDRPVTSFSIAQRMCWASRRKTTRVEDQAYSLLGIFGVNMPIIYGEGEGAFTRLQEEILRNYSDHTIFAWSERDDCWSHRHLLDSHFNQPSSNLLASSAYAFRNSGNLVPVNTDKPHRAYEIVSGTIQLVVPTTTPASDFMKIEAVLNCHDEDDCSREVCINLYNTGTPDLYRVQGEQTEPRIQMKDIFAMSSSCETRTINIMRHVDRLQPGPRKNTRRTILCRLRDRNTSSDFQLHGRARYHDVSWNESTQSFMGILDVVNLYGYLANVSLANLNGPEILGSIDIRYGDDVYGRLNLSRNPLGHFVSFSKDTPSYYEWRGRLLKAVAPASLTWYRGFTIFATLEKRQLLHAELDVIYIEVAGNWLAFKLGVYHAIRTWLQFWRARWRQSMDPRDGWSTSGHGVKSALLGCLLFPLTVGIPVLAISIARGRAGMDESQALALKVGMPLALLATCIVILKEERLFIDDGRRMMLFTLLTFVNIVQAALCGLYGRSVLHHLSLLDRYDVGSLPEVGMYENAWRVAITWSVLSGLFALSFIFYRPACSLRILPSVGGKFTLIHLTLSLIVIARFAAIATELPSVLRPWTESECTSEERDDLSGAANFYTAISNATKGNFGHTCKSFALEGRLLLSILSLAIWTLMVDLGGAVYIGWLVFRLQMPLKKRILVY